MGENVFNKKIAYPSTVFFFSYVKTKSVRETFFWPFFEFFHAQKIAFTHTFLQVFTYGENFSRALFMIFSRMDFVFSRGEFRYFSKFSRMGFVFFTGKKWRIWFLVHRNNCFNENWSEYFSRRLFTIFTHVIWEKFSRTVYYFHG